MFIHQGDLLLGIFYLQFYKEAKLPHSKSSMQELLSIGETTTEEWTWLSLKFWWIWKLVQSLWTFQLGHPGAHVCVWVQALTACIFSRPLLWFYQKVLARPQKSQSNTEILKRREVWMSPWKFENLTSGDTRGMSLGHLIHRKETFYWLKLIWFWEYQHRKVCALVRSIYRKVCALGQGLLAKYKGLQYDTTGPAEWDSHCLVWRPQKIWILRNLVQW